MYNNKDGTWDLYNHDNGKCATIHRIHEYNAITDVPPRYRVDSNGTTVDTMIYHFQTARSVAYQKIK